MQNIKDYLLTSDFLSPISEWLIKLALALAIYIVGKWIARFLHGWTVKIMNVRGVDPSAVTFLGNVVYASLLAAVILAALDKLGVPITSLVAIMGAAGLAIGLAMKDSLGNFAAGVMLVIFRPFKKGDVIEAAGITGKVDEIRIFSTMLITPDNKLVIIPNGQVAAGTITNYTAKEIRRVDMVFGVGYNDDLKLARDVLTRVVTSHTKVLSDPELNIFVLNLGESSVDFAVRPWVKTEDYWTVWGDVLEQAKMELEAAGCSIPYPQRDVHLFNEGGEG